MRYGLEIQTRQIKVCANHNMYNTPLLSFKENSSKMSSLGTHGTNQSVFQPTVFTILTIFTIGRKILQM